VIHFILHFSLLDGGVMRILFIAAHLPTPRRVRPYQLLRTLAARGHEISLICASNAEEQVELVALSRLCQKVIAVEVSAADRWRNAAYAMANALPFGGAAPFASPLLDAIRSVAAEQYDIAHIDGLQAAPLSYALPPLPTVLDAGACVGGRLQGALASSLLKRAAAVAELARTRRTEASYSTRFERIVAASPDDAWGLRTLANELIGNSGAPIHTIPNGVDLDYFAPQGHQRAQATLVLSGRMAAPEDEAAALFLARMVLPEIWRIRADVQLFIIGAEPTPAIQALANDQRIYVSGAVSDIRPHLARATLAVVPAPGNWGVPNRMLEAMAMGTPVLADKAIGRTMNLDDGHTVALASDPAGYARTILAMLDDPRWRGQLGRAGRRFVEEHCTWHRAVADFEQVYAAARGIEIAEWRLEVGLHRLLT
jgi:polysaccharide biosynthesis protein PslH